MSFLYKISLLLSFQLSLCASAQINSDGFRNYLDYCIAKRRTPNSMIYQLITLSGINNSIINDGGDPTRLFKEYMHDIVLAKTGDGSEVGNDVIVDYFEQYPDKAAAIGEKCIENGKTILKKLLLDKYDLEHGRNVDAKTNVTVARSRNDGSFSKSGAHSRMRSSDKR